MDEQRREDGCELWRRYENARRYQASIRMTTLLPRYVDFYEGRQWPEATEATKGMPRPVINIVKNICRNKKSIILSTPVKCVYKAAGTQDVNALNDFAAYIDKEIQQERHDREAVDCAVKKGTAIWHYYWDAEGRGFDGRADGAMRVETVDPLRCFFADPSEPDEQKQEWIIFASREPVKTVKAKADKSFDLSLIAEDEGEDPYGKKEQDGTEMCTVLTCYYRRDGEVVVCKAVKQGIFQAEKKLAGDLDEAARMIREAGDKADEESDSIGADAANSGMPDVGRGDEKTRAVKRARSYLYPVVVWRYEPREGSIYGIGEVEGLIPNQKAVNFMYAMMIYNVQQMAWGKYVVMPGALKGQRITTQPGQTLTDWTKTGKGISTLSGGGTMNGQPLAIAQELMGATRNMTGSTEVLNGELPSASLSGAAITQLQSQALMPSEDIRNGFWMAKERQGRVKEQFFKTFYTGERYIRRAVTDELDENGDNVEERTEQVFNSYDWADTVLDITCEATAGTKASAAADVQVLETAYQKGDIDFVTLLTAYPRDALGNRTEILRAIRARESGEIVQAQMMLQQYQAQLEQYAEQLAEQGKAFDAVQSIIAENVQLQQKLAVLRKEAEDKINAANREILAGNAAISEARADAAEFAGVIAEKAGLLPAVEGGD